MAEAKIAEMLLKTLGPPLLGYFLGGKDRETQGEALDAQKLLALTQADALQRRAAVEEPFRASVFESIAKMQEAPQRFVRPSGVAVTNPFLNLNRASIGPSGQVQTTPAVPGGQQQFINPANFAVDEVPGSGTLSGGLMDAMKARAEEMRRSREVWEKRQDPDLTGGDRDIVTTPKGDDEALAANIKRLEDLGFVVTRTGDGRAGAVVSGEEPPPAESPPPANEPPPKEEPKGSAIDTVTNSRRRGQGR